LLGVLAVLSLPRVHAEVIVPLSVGGAISYGYVYTRAGDLESQSNILNLNINSSSYIWQPWFATLDAGAGFGLSSSESSRVAESKSTLANADLSLLVFPISRFPFTLTYSISRNEQDTAGGIQFARGRESTVQRLGLRQDYTTRDQARYSLWYNHTRYRSDTANDFNYNVFGFSMIKKERKQRFNVNAIYNFNKQFDPDRESNNLNVLFNHNYYPSPELGVNSLLGYSRSEAKSILDGQDSNKTTGNVSQVSSSFYWRPEHRPYVISGGVRFSRSERETTEVRSANTNATGTYQFSRRVRGTAAVNIGATESGGQQSLTSSQIASLDYGSDQYVILGFFYNWHANIGASNSYSRIDQPEGTQQEQQPLSTTEEGNVQTVSSSLGHAAGRGWALGRNAQLNLNLAQSVTGSKASDQDEATSSLTHSASMGWNHTAWGGTTLIHVSGSDTRSLHLNENVFQLATVQLTRDQAINRLSSTSGNIYLQVSRTKNIGGQEGADTQKTAAFNLDYTHSRVFGIYGLRFKSRLTSSNLIAEDDTATRGTLDWDNEFHYTIGLLTASLTLRMVQTASEDRTYSMFFRVVRSF
jgi:hypothetical protein